MKKSTTVQELKKEYNPQEIIDAVEESFQKHRAKLVSIIGHSDSPILNYNQNQQISFLENDQDQNTIIDEVVELFPGKYIHIGGDEAPKTNWKACKNCQNVINNFRN